MPSRSSIFLALAAAFGLAAVVVGVSPQVRAGPPPPVTTFAADQVRGTPRAVALVVRRVGGAAWLEAVRSGGGPAPRSLAASPDGRSVVVSDLDPGQIGPLIIARDDGSQIEVALPGVRGAAFDASGDWLAVVDMAGALWRVESGSGLANRLTDGPFAADLAWLTDGRILALRMSSADAPTWAAVVTVDPLNGGELPAPGASPATEQLVYQAVPLVDDGFVLVRHLIGGGMAVVEVAPDGSEELLLERDGTSSVDVSPDGEWVAWAADGRAWIAATAAATPPRGLGPAMAVRFSPDGSYLLLFNADRAVVFDRAGTRLADAGGSACWMGGGRGCRP